MPPAPPPPPRARSKHEEAFADFQSDREDRFEQLGVAFVVDEHVDQKTKERKPYGPAYINSTISRLMPQVKHLGPEEAVAGGAPTGWERVVALWLEHDWGAKIDPPYAFSAFASEKIFPNLVKKLEERG